MTENEVSSPQDEQLEEFPAPQEFFTKVSLYKGYKINNPAQVYGIEFFTGTIDVYCHGGGCNRTSVFQSDVSIPSALLQGNWRTPVDVQELLTASQINLETYIPVFRPHDSLQDRYPELNKHYLLNRFFVVRFHCTRNLLHYIHYCFYVKDSQLIKIGQYPSIADLDKAEIEKYRNVLSKEKFSELSRANGLYANGVGVGSFVYLRRIFEDLIEEARVKASTSDKWDDKEYQKIHVDEKILLLKDYLPDFLIEHRKIYGILSKGLHELSEDECNEYFPVIKLAIELILDEKLEQKEKEQKIKQAQNGLANILGELKSKGNDSAK